MARFIDADRLLRDPYFQEDRWPESHLIRMAVGEQRTVDAVPVVRCKDCEFCHYNSSADTYKCTSMNGMYRTVSPDDFCSYGERKDNE